MEQEILRLKKNGVAVLQQVTVEREQVPVTHVYFDTERDGKFALGLVYRPGGMRAAAGPAVVSHFGAVVWDAAAVSAYWEKLGFPRFPSSMSRHELIPDTETSRSRWHSRSAISATPSSAMSGSFPHRAPANIYADFLNRHHREGIQHIGMPVDDLARSVAVYEKLGYHVRQAEAWGDVGKAGAGQYAYMDTDSLGGISVELVQGH